MGYDILEIIEQGDMTLELRRVRFEFRLPRYELLHFENDELIDRYMSFTRDELERKAIELIEENYAKMNPIEDDNEFWFTSLTLLKNKIEELEASLDYYQKWTERLEAKDDPDIYDLGHIRCNYQMMEDISDEIEKHKDYQLRIKSKLGVE